MSTFNLFLPHPLLVQPVLYVADVPNGVKWVQVQNIFSSCGAVRSGGKGSVPGTNRRRWKVIFPNLISAEMALATLSGVEVKGVVPPWHLLLSHSPLLEEVLPEHPVLPLFLRNMDNNQPFWLKHNAQAVFCWFRRAGPLVSVRLDVDVGYETLACVVQYWQEDHALFARSQGPAISPFSWTLRFILQAYNPWNLYCTKLGSGISTEELQAQFAKYGEVSNTSVIAQGKPNAFGFVSFSTREAAQKAMTEMNGCKLGDSEIVIRYHEPKTKKALRPHPGARMKFPQSAENDAPTAVPPKPTSSPSEARAMVDVQLRRIKAEQAEASAVASASRAEEYEKEQAEKLAVADQTEKTAQKALELARSVLQEAQVALELAQARFTQSSEQAELATVEKQTALKELHSATQDKDTAMSKAKEARKKKQEVLREERELRGLGPEDVLETNDSEDTEEPKREEEAKQRDAEMEELRKKKEDLRKQEEADKLEQEAKAREAEAREAELRESLKRMAEFEAEEKRRKQEKEEVFKRAREAREAAKREKEKKDREEAERRVREAREKAEREKREAQDRVMRYHTAATKEGTRCRLRDEARWKRHIAWTPLKSIERFRIVSDEFDDIKFSATQPLTFGSIPWPTLHSPYTVKFDNIDWQAVEDFFKKLRLTTDADDYRTLVEKAHRRFHPDKWRSRGLLNTILDDGLRETVEKTGNIVAQALTPIWLESRSK